MRNQAVTAIAFVAIVAALKWSCSVTMPIAAAAFIIAAAWPIKPWLDRLLPAPLSYLGTVLGLLLMLGVFGGGLYLAMSQVARTFLEREADLRAIYDTYASWAKQHGLIAYDNGTGLRQLMGFAQFVGSKIYTLFGYIGFIAVLVMLGLPEVPAMSKRLRVALEASNRRAVVATVDSIAEKFRRYVGVTTLTSLVTGIASAVWAYAVGLDLALTWGVLNFLLNYIPVAGNIIGIVPPTLYAILQFRDWTMAGVVFVGYAVLQIAISNFLYPWLQGRGLSLSPLAVVVSLAFWSWIWGIGGALLAVPLTAAVVVVCEKFEATMWIAKLVSTEQPAADA